MSDLLQRLEEGRIFSFDALTQPGGGLLLHEECDRYFSLSLTKEEVRELAATLIAMSERAP